MTILLFRIKTVKNINYKIQVKFENIAKHPFTKPKTKYSSYFGMSIFLNSYKTILNIERGKSNLNFGGSFIEFEQFVEWLLNKGVIFYQIIGNNREDDIF